MKKSTKKVKESTAASRQTEDGAIKEITPKKRKKGRYILIYLAIIGFVFYAVITIINQNVQIAEKKAELTDLQQQISVVEIQSQYLKKVQNYKGDDLKKYIEKINKLVIEWILKLVLFNITVIAAWCIVMYVLQIPDDSMGMLGQYGPYILLALGNVTFIIYDIALTGLIGMYMQKIHPFLKKLFKIH